jgi:predicted nucleic acid-binding protein
MNVVDSSAWLAWFADEAGAKSFEDSIEDTASLLVPSICLTEVFKVVARQRSEGDALQAIAVMHQGEIIPLDSDLAVSAALIGLRHKLPLADSVVYATARSRGATLWTQDEDFEGLPQVRFFRKHHG